MAITIPNYETERGNEGGDVKHIPEVNDLNAVIDRVNAVAATVTQAAATLVTGVVEDNNAILWTAAADGEDGNDITVGIAVPAGAGVDLAVTVQGSAITVHSATVDAGVASSTAADVIAAVAGSAPASALVTVDDDSTSNGTGVVASAAPAPLAGGTGFPDPLSAVVAA